MGNHISVVYLIMLNSSLLQSSKQQLPVKIKSKWIENENIKDYDPKEYWNPKLFIENALHVILYNLYI